MSHLHMLVCLLDADERLVSLRLQPLRQLDRL